MKYTVGNRQKIELWPASVSFIHSPFIKWITIHRHSCQTASVMIQQQLSADTATIIGCHTKV